MRIGPLSIPAGHPALAGHFPNNPIAPGVVTLDWVIRSARQSGHTVKGVAKAKFTAPLPPDTPFHIELSVHADSIDFRVVGDQISFVQGTLSLAEPESQ